MAARWTQKKGRSEFRLVAAREEKTHPLRCNGACLKSIKWGKEPRGDSLNSAEEKKNAFPSRAQMPRSKESEKPLLPQEERVRDVFWRVASETKAKHCTTFYRKNTSIRERSTGGEERTALDKRRRSGPAGRWIKGEKKDSPSSLRKGSPLSHFLKKFPAGISPEVRRRDSQGRIPSLKGRGGRL